jgi:hypothetical protein
MLKNNNYNFSYSDYISIKNKNRQKLIIVPNSYDYKIFWEEQMNRCLAGYWVSGKWMPPRLYYYINFHHIKMNKGKHSKTLAGYVYIGGNLKEAYRNLYKVGNTLNENSRLATFNTGEPDGTFVFHKTFPQNNFLNI